MHPKAYCSLLKFRMLQDTHTICCFTPQTAYYFVGIQGMNLKILINYEEVNVFAGKKSGRKYL